MIKYFFSSSVILIFAFICFAGCSSTQSTVYKPDDAKSGWKINVTKKDNFTSEFICTINDSVVIKESFPLIGDNIEKSGMYRGKKVLMNGFRNSTTVTDSEGKVTTQDKYQIRVFINDKLVDKFDF